jgi:ABC-type transport system involved in cytochrome c biogenesis permease subunit
LLTIGILSEQFGQTKLGVLSWERKRRALITWFVFAIICILEFLKVGPNAQRIALFGFIIIWICYLGVNLLGKGLHSYGFFS